MPPRGLKPDLISRMVTLMLKASPTQLKEALIDVAFVAREDIETDEDASNSDCGLTPEQYSEMLKLIRNAF